MGRPRPIPCPGLVLARMRWAGRLAALRLTVRTKILFAFLALGAITGGLGGYAFLGVREAGDLVSVTFDRALMSIGYARAAGADFAGMESLLARRRAADGAGQVADLDGRSARLAESLRDDLGVAAERALSDDARQAARDAGEAVAAWDAARARLLAGAADAAAWADLDRIAASVTEQIDLLIEYTAGDGFRLRQRAAATVQANSRLNLAGTAAALLFGATVALLLARRIMGPVAAASAAASRIADGELDTSIPRAGADELGALLAAMATMRDKIRATMQREVAMRRSAQVRLVDAMESSHEGVIVVDPEDRIAVANTQVGRFFPDLAGRLVEGEAFTVVADSPSGRAAFLSAVDGGSAEAGAGVGAAAAAQEVRLPTGRWLRVGRSATQDGGFVAICSDITSLKAQQAELERTNLCFDAALSNMSQGLCLYDAAGRLRVANASFGQMYGLPDEVLKPGILFENVVRFSGALGLHGDRDVEALIRDRLAYIRKHESGTVFQELGDGRIIAISHEPMADGGWVATYEDITERRRAEAQITFMARHDALTGLPNRVLFRERLAQAVAGLGRGQAFAILCVDLDHFKAVNDTMGHPVGDQLLRQAAERLLACVRETDTIARLGGDEFAVVQAGLDRPESAGELARRIVEVVGAPYQIDGHRASVGVSIGIAVAPGDGNGADGLLRNADLALYRAKQDGRGTFCFFEAEMDARQQARRALEADLRCAIENGQLELFYQPLVNLEADRVSGFEALLRWRHPTRGMVSPAEFIPVAEEAGLIVAIGEWVLGRACAQAAGWPDDIKVAVNVSPLQFRSARLVQAVEDALSLSGLSSGRLELEITESVLLQDNEATLSVLHRLKGLGLRISMDDFGTGYSSLSYLRSFPFDKIKIDQSFVRHLGAAGTGTEAADDDGSGGADPDGSGAIVRAISGLGSSLGMKTLAEGVETEAQLARLRREGLTEVQGYLFSRPAPAGEVPGIIARLGGGVDAGCDGVAGRRPAVQAAPRAICRQQAA